MEFKKKLFQINLMELLFYAGMVSISFLAVIFTEAGMDGTTVGIIMSAVSIVSMFAPPLFGVMADKFGVRMTYCIAMIGASAFWLLVPFTITVKLGTIPLTVIWILTGTIFRSSHESLMDSWLMKIQDSEPSFNYSNTRKYGSLGYATMAVLSTPIAATFGTGAVFLLMPITLIPILFLAKRIGDPGPAVGAKAAPAKKKGEKLQLGRLFRSYPLMIFLFCVIFMRMPFSASSIQLQYLLKEITGDTSLVGLLAGIKAFLEFPCFILVPIIAKKVKPVILICAVFIYYGVEALLLGIAQDLWLVILLQMTSGVGFAIMLATVINYVHSLAPEGLSATAVTANTAVMGFSGILTNMICGVLRDTVGFRTGYFVVGAIGITAVGLFMVLQMFVKKKKAV
ncbi:MAG: MFS transporter [Clostridiales bacterium]|nr:MFS transporter [Clostridiales bacterium]